MINFIDFKDPSLIEIIKILLKDRTTNKNIIFATDSYIDLGNSFDAHSCITLRSLNTKKFNLKARVYKTLEEQKDRTKEKAEVFILIG